MNKIKITKKEGNTKMEPNVILTRLIRLLKKADYARVRERIDNLFIRKRLDTFRELLLGSWSWNHLHVGKVKNIKFTKIENLLIKLYKNDNYKKSWLPCEPATAVAFVKLVESISNNQGEIKHENKR